MDSSMYVSNVGLKQHRPPPNIRYSKDICSRAKREQDTYRLSSRDSLDEPLTSKRSNVGSKQCSPQSSIYHSKDFCSRTKRGKNTNGDTSRDTLDEPLACNGSNLISKQHSPPSSIGYSKYSTVSLLGRDEDPDGEMLEVGVEDPELVRKMMELRKIEEEIMLKKAALAHKKVEPSVKKNEEAHCVFKGEKQGRLAQSPGFSYEQSTAFKAETLKERVSVILQQRHPLGCVSKVHLSSSDTTHALLQSHKDGMKSLSLNSDGRLQEDHPLKARVKTLMKQRHRNIQLSLSDRDREVCDILPPPPSQSLASAIEEDSDVNKGFLRFLRVLNKGVDISLLSRIVNGDGEDIPVGNVPLNSQPPVMDNKSDLPYRSESQPSLCEVKEQSHSRSKSGERTEPPTQEGSHNNKHSTGEEEKNDRDRCFGSHSRSESPPAVDVKKTKVEEQHEQLQNVLRTLGLSLEAEEMSQLADRTQERLYGKRQDDKQWADHRAEQEILQRNVHRENDHSSCSSRSISSSFSPSSPRLLRSSSGDSPERRRASEGRCSRDRSRDTLMTLQDGNEDSKSAQKNQDSKVDSEEISPHLHPYPENLVASAAMPYQSVDQYHAAYYSGIYNGATNSDCNFTQGTISSPHYPVGFPYQQKSSYHSVAAPGRVYPYHNSFEDFNLMANADLCKSEGQTGKPARPRCLQAVYTNAAQRQRSVLQITNSSKKREKRNQKRRQRRKEQREQMIKNMKAQHITVSEEVADDVIFSVPNYADDPPMANAKEGAITQHSEEAKPHPIKLLNVPVVWDSPRLPYVPTVPTAAEVLVREPFEEVKAQPTEEEIKANLKKKLEAFNQKMKQKGQRPAGNSLQ